MKTLRYFFVAALAMVGMNAMAGEPAYKLTFPNDGGKEVSGYEATWTATVGTDEWTIFGFNTNKNAWDHIRCGRKQVQEGAYIESPVLAKEIAQFVVNVDQTSAVTKATLAVGDQVTDITSQFKAGELVFDVTGTNGKKIKLTIDSGEASANGNTRISKIALYEAGQYTVVDIANTEETAYTIAKAIELIEAGEGLSTEVFVKGIVSKVDSYNETYGSISYWISEDGTTTTQQFQIYGGLNKNGEKFTAQTDVAVGASVIVKGKIKKYQDKYEMDMNNQLVKYEASGAGIAAAKNAKTQNGVMYNLAGQVVNKGYKGLVIMNGRKFMNK